MDLKGKVALVTGGAHRLGKAFALALAGEGANVLVHYGGSETKARETVEEIAALGVTAQTAQADLSDPEDIARLFDTTREAFGRLDVLVNSAAAFQPKPFMDISLEDWDFVLNVNLRAPFLCSQHAARMMKANDGGVIVNIADLFGFRPQANFAHHGISKAGLILLTQVAALALGPEIRVNAIAPGAVLPPASMDMDRWQRFGEFLPGQQTGDPENAQQALLHLVQNEFVNGHVLVVDGGESLLGPFWGT